MARTSAASRRSRPRSPTTASSRAQTVKHRVEVVRAANSAEIDLEWDAGARHRLGAVQYSDVQFPDKFLQRYTPWREGDFYSTEKLLNLQQALVDADYFSAVAVTPDLEHVQDAVVPVEVVLVPAKRNVYTANVYVSTDSGPGTRLGYRAALAQRATATS